MQSIHSPADFQTAFGVSRETLQRLEIYAETLVSWQKAINLVASGTLSEVWHRHFADSAQLVRVVDVRKVITWVDIGSGAGFPGLVIGALLADAAVPCRVVLIESDAKKCAFLREVVRKMAIGPTVAVDILAERIETAAVSTKVTAADVVSARALAGLDKLFELSIGLFGPGTVGVFPKGKDVMAEIEQAKVAWAFDYDLTPSLTDDAARVVVVRNLVSRQR